MGFVPKVMGFGGAGLASELLKKKKPTPVTAQPTLTLSNQSGGGRPSLIGRSLY